MAYLRNLPPYTGAWGVDQTMVDYNPTDPTFSVDVTAPKFDWTPWIIFLSIVAVLMLSPEKKERAK